jgi:hypothetical protein
LGAEPRLPSFPAWRSPGPTAPGEEPREPGYAGWAHVEEEPYEFRSLETFRLVEETQLVDGGGDLTRSDVEWGLSLDEALRIARGRSEVVVVGTGWPGNYSYEDAGSRSYKPLPYPRFPL